MVDVSRHRINPLAKLSSDVVICPAATLSLLPDAAQLSFRGGASALDAAGTAFGVGLPRQACRFNTRGNRTAYWVGPDEWLLAATDESPETVSAAMTHALSGHACSLVDVSHRTDAFAIKGESCEYLLNHGCPLDLSARAFPVGMCSRTLLGKAPVLLSRWDADEFHLREFSDEFFFDALGAEAEEAEEFAAGGAFARQRIDGQAVVAVELAGVDGSGVAGGF